MIVRVALGLLLGIAPVAVATSGSPVATGSPARSGEIASADSRAAEERFAAANAAFAAGKYEEAIAGFRAIVESSGYSPALLFDLGNAYFRAGRLGEAILWYERARLLAPGDPDVLANLRRARQAANLPAPEETGWFRFADGVSADSLAIISSAALFLVAAMWIALRVGRSALRERRGLRLGIASAIGAGLVMTAAAGLLSVTRLQELARAVVLDPEAGLLVAPYEAATVSSSLDPGEVVAVEQRHHDFALVRTASGHSGWVHRNAIEGVLPE